MSEYPCDSLLIPPFGVSDPIPIMSIVPLLYMLGISPLYLIIDVAKPLSLVVTYEGVAEIKLPVIENVWPGLRFPFKSYETIERYIKSD